jgi:hypothetical protein
MLTFIFKMEFISKYLLARKYPSADDFTGEIYQTFKEIIPTFEETLLDEDRMRKCFPISSVRPPLS